MTYRVEFHAAALTQLRGLPGAAFDALVERAVELVAEPWDARVLDSEQPEFRQAIFAASGLMSFGRGGLPRNSGSVRADVLVTRAR